MNIDYPSLTKPSVTLEKKEVSSKVAFLKSLWLIGHAKVICVFMALVTSNISKALDMCTLNEGLLNYPELNTDTKVKLYQLVVAYATQRAIIIDTIYTFYLALTYYCIYSGTLGILNLIIYLSERLTKVRESDAEEIITETKLYSEIPKANRRDKFIIFCLVLVSIYMQARDQNSGCTIYSLTVNIFLKVKKLLV